MKRNEFDYYEDGPSKRWVFLLIFGLGLLIAAAAYAGNGNGNSNGQGPGSDNGNHNGNGNANGHANGHDKGNGDNNGNHNGQGPKHGVFRVEMVNRNALLTCSGEAGTNYCIEATESLVPPINWVPICTNSVASSSQFQYLDTCASNYPSRFYRLVTAAEAGQHTNNGNHNGIENGHHYGKGHVNGNDHGNGNDNTIGGN